MPDRFLLYSLRRKRPVKALLMLERIQSVTLTAISMTDDTLTYMTARKKTPQSIPLSSVLSVGYARGDDGQGTQD